MTAVTRSVNGAIIVDVAGHIDLGTSPALRRTMLDALKTTGRLMVNLAGVRYIDSSGIASLLEVLKEAKAREKLLVLYSLTAAVSDVLNLTRLTRVFEICETEEQALKKGAPAEGARS